MKSASLFGRKTDGIALKKVAPLLQLRVKENKQNEKKREI